MRKLIVKYKPKPEYMEEFNVVSKYVTKIELVDIINVDIKSGTGYSVHKFYFKDNYTFNDLPIPENIRAIKILNEEPGTGVCLLQKRMPIMIQQVFGNLPNNIMWDKPNEITKDHIIMSLTGPTESLKEVVKSVDDLGEIISVSYKKTDYAGRGILTVLTEHQRNIFQKAKRMGYYKYPRKISATDLATELNMSKSTLVEHLRKIENKILERIH